SLKTSIKTITYLSDTGCLEIQGASLPVWLILITTFTRLLISSAHHSKRRIQDFNPSPEVQ
ncbi:hypothetical protein PSZ74_11745, partial [Shigella sonnei]|nr:hypothetical protein [Shigella sonnei]